MVLALGEQIILYMILGGVAGILYTLRKVYALERSIARVEMHVESMLQGKKASAKKKK